MSDERGTAGWDVLVIGAGPAGATTAALLAGGGHRVLVLEKEHFPRFHIGESLLPAGLSVLDRLGIDPWAEANRETFIFKRGAEFVCEASGRSQAFVFSEALPGCAPNSWHVERANFDTLLRDRARAMGAEVRHGETVVDAGVQGDGVWVETRSGRFEGRYLVDASGQSRLLARRAGTSVPYERFGKSAAFTHYEGLGDAACAELGPHNDIRIMLRPEGWGWIIPLPGRRLSVGMVSTGKMTPEELEAGLLGGPMVQRLTRGATRLETRVHGNYSYRNSRPCGPRFVAVGDAACFLDPVFSSGVTLAMRGGEAIADAVGPALAAGREGDSELLSEHHAAMDRAYRTFAGLIDRFYNSRIADSLFLKDPEGMPMRNGVMSVLAGDVWREGNEFQEMLLSSRRYNTNESTSPN